MSVCYNIEEEEGGGGGGRRRRRRRKRGRSVKDWVSSHRSGRKNQRTRVQNEELLSIV